MCQQHKPRVSNQFLVITAMAATLKKKSGGVCLLINKQIKGEVLNTKWENGSGIATFSLQSSPNIFFQYSPKLLCPDLLGWRRVLSPSHQHRNKFLSYQDLLSLIFLPICAWTFSLLAPQVSLPHNLQCLWLCLAYHRDSNTIWWAQAWLYTFFYLRKMVYHLSPSNRTHKTTRTRSLMLLFSTPLKTETSKPLEKGMSKISRSRGTQVGKKKFLKPRESELVLEGIVGFGSHHWFNLLIPCDSVFIIKNSVHLLLRRHCWGPMRTIISLAGNIFGLA